MIVHADRDENYKVEAKHFTCPFHRKHLNKRYAGCTCCSIWVGKPSRKVLRSGKWVQFNIN